MSRHQVDAPSTQSIEQSIPSSDLRVRRIADVLARQQEDCDGFAIKKTASETPATYQLRRRAARQAALKVISSTKGDRPHWLTMWVSAVAAFSILAFLKLKYG